MTARLETFSAAAINEKRALLRNALAVPEDQLRQMKDGFTISRVDPMSALGHLEALSLKKGYVLRAYQFFSGANGNGFVCALPVGSPVPNPQNCRSTPAEVVLGVTLDRPKPPGALEHVMDAFEGDGAAMSFLEASLLSRELEEFGALWHGCEWGTHAIVDANPLTARRMASGDRGNLGKPADWKWKVKEPGEWAPSVKQDADSARVRFLSVSELGQCAFYEHIDRYVSGSYCPASKRRILAWGPGGYVF